MGLAIADSLIKEYQNILIVEKEDTFGKHISSRNSEVIHSGFYYKTGGLKAKLCVEGNQLMYKFCRKYEIDHKNCGKMIITNTNSDHKRLEKLLENGKNNGVKGMRIISGNEAQQKEPLIDCDRALYVPSTGIVDSHGVMNRLEYNILSSGSFILYQMKVNQIKKQDNDYLLFFNNTDQIATSKIVINAAGLWSDNIAKMIGLDDYKIHYYKGEYYHTSLFRNKINTLIYPLPTQYSLGIHLVVHLDGTIGFGPNAYYIDDIDYDMDESNKEMFLKHINTFLKIKAEDLTMDYTGIRPKVQGPGEHHQDFIIRNEADKGLKNLISLIGIDSPGLTSSLAIAKYVKTLIQ